MGEALDMAGVQALTEQHLGWAVTQIQVLGGGRNSRVYALQAPSGERVVAKVYFRHPNDPRDRLGTEFQACQFLWGQGLRDLPRPVRADREAGVAWYDWLPGEPALQRPASPADLQGALAFVARLRAVREAPEAAKLPWASEAGVVPGQVLASLDQRAARLAPVADEALQSFLRDELAPRRTALIAASREWLGASAQAWEEPLAERYRTLSPSDFGFHNAIRHPLGHLQWLDFEYFGWDDPAKLLADFVLHPAMALAPAEAQVFSDGVLAIFAEDPELPRRWRALLPLYGLKWVYILLNEFLVADRERRQFAAAAPAARPAPLAQLAKARDFLAKLWNRHECFNDYQPA